MVGLDRIVGVLLDVVPRPRDQLVKDRGIDRGGVGNLCRDNSPFRACELAIPECGQAARRYSLIKPWRIRRLRTGRSSGTTM
ncbi:hypothetical protein, partial [Dactylosporangium darangshiense]|uniref:hypothetical protein n=1 Tax=Dactylosporangium darangshiense TaxID=579108 RepID=UPI0031ED029D